MPSSTWQKSEWKMVVGSAGGDVLESHMNPDRPVAPEQLDAFLHYQFFRLTPAGVHRMLEQTSLRTSEWSVLMDVARQQLLNHGHCLFAVSRSTFMLDKRNLIEWILKSDPGCIIRWEHASSFSTKAPWLIGSNRSAISLKHQWKGTCERTLKWKLKKPQKNFSISIS